MIHYTIHRPISELKLEEQIHKGIEKANDLKMKTISVPVDCIGGFTLLRHKLDHIKTDG